MFFFLINSKNCIRYKSQERIRPMYVYVWEIKLAFLIGFFQVNSVHNAQFVTP